MLARIAVLSLLLAVSAGQVAYGQSAPVVQPPPAQAITPVTVGLVGKWGSTMNGFDKDQQPPYYFEENVQLTISANGNIQLERARREKNHKEIETMALNGVYTMPQNGIMLLTFAEPVGQVPAIWQFVIRGNTMWIIDDATGLQRKYLRIFTQYY